MTDCFVVVTYVKVDIMVALEAGDKHFRVLWDIQQKPLFMFYVYQMYNTFEENNAAKTVI